MTGDADWIRDSLDAHPADHPASFFLGKEFVLWLWWRSERQNAAFDLPDIGPVELWLDDRLQLASQGEKPQTSDLKGGAPAFTSEAKMALRAGKFVETARVGMRVRDREYAFVLHAETLEMAGLKLPSEVDDGVDERIYERMFLIEEASAVIDALFVRFCEERLEPLWDRATVPAMREWIAAEALGDIEG